MIPEWSQTFGFVGYDRADMESLASEIAKRIGIPAQARENFYYGDYFRFSVGRGQSAHLLVWNEMPRNRPDPDEAPDPELLDWKSLLWIAEGCESDSLTAALLAIPGAKMLRAPSDNGRN